MERLARERLHDECARQGQDAERPDGCESGIPKVREPGVDAPEGFELKTESLGRFGQRHEPRPIDCVRSGIGRDGLDNERRRGRRDPGDPDPDHMRDGARIDLEDLGAGLLVGVGVPVAKQRAELGEDRLDEGFHRCETSSSEPEPCGARTCRHGSRRPSHGRAATVIEPEGEGAVGEAASFREEAGHFRGSTLLFFGKFIGLALDLATQIIIVRALSRTEFGAFTFGLSVASLAATLALLGLDKTISRFVPLYDEEGDQRRLAGSLILAFGVVAGVSAAMMMVLIGLQSQLGEEVVESELARELLVILFLLAPIRAFDSLLTACFAIFGRARSIVIRRNIVAPGLQLIVVVIVLMAEQPPEVLAIGYVIAGFVGLAAFAVVLARLLQQKGIADRIRRRDFIIPTRAVLGFSLPLLSSDIVFLLRTSAVVILLQYLATSSEVAAYGAVLPLARQNLIVYQAFGFLFVPVASRLFARGENARLRNMYWQTSAWIAVATFPALALSVALAGPLTLLLFGQSYADSASVLAILAVGHYVSAALGFNALTLRVQGRVTFIVVVDVLSAVISVAASVILIRTNGAVGAAIATAATLIVQNVLYQAGLAGSSVGLPERKHVVTFLAIAVAVGGLTLLQMVTQMPLPIGVALAAIVSAGLLIVSRGSLQIGRYFPELLKVPILRRLIGGPDAEVSHGA